MSKNVSRRSFLKGMMGVTGAAALTQLSVLSGVAIAEGVYTPGTYTATAQGINTVSVTMTFSETAITDVVLDLAGETPSIGQVIAEDLKAALMNAQSAEIDAVSGATVTTKAVMKAAEKCIKQAKGEIPVEVADSAAQEEGTASWLGKEPEIPESMIAETITTDFLIVGAGNGG